MRNLDFNQNSILNIFINLEIIGEEDKNKKKYYTIYIFYFIKILKIFLQFGVATCHNYGF